MGPSAGKASALAALGRKTVAPQAASGARGPGPSPGAAVLHPSPNYAADFPSLGSLHSCGSNRLAEGPRLT
jgi:hypothetical protein